MADRALQVVDQTTGVLTRADEWNQRRVQFVIDHLCGGAPAPEAAAFIEICKRRGLAPEEKQVYLIKRRTKEKDENGKDKWIDTWTPQTGIDGYRLMADRTGKYAGSDDPVFHDEDEFTTGKDDWTKQVIHPLAATVTVWKIVDGIRCPFSATARWREYYPGEKNGKFWHTMPYTMLGKCAEALALRKAFPADLSGIYTNEEMAQADRENVIEASGRTVQPPPKAVAGPGAASPEQFKRIAELAKAMGLTKKDQIQAKAGKPVNTLTPNEANILIGEWEAELKSVQVAQTAADPDTGELPEPTDLLGGDAEHYGASSDLGGVAGNDKYSS